MKPNIFTPPDFIYVGLILLAPYHPTSPFFFFYKNWKARNTTKQKKRGRRAIPDPLPRELVWTGTQIRELVGTSLPHGRPEGFLLDRVLGANERALLLSDG